MRTRYKLISLVLALGLALTLALGRSPGVGIGGAEAAPAAGRQIVEAYRLHHHVFPKSYDGQTSTLHLQNPTYEEASVALSFYDLQDGAPALDMYDTIPNGGKLVLPADSMAGLPEGARYSLVVASDQPVESVVRMHRSVPQGDELASYRGVSSGSEDLHFGPFHKNWAADASLVNSSVVVRNITQNAATVSVDFIDFAGSLVATTFAELDPDEQWTVDSASQEELPDGFRGWVRVSATEPIVGWLHQLDASGEVFQVYEFLSSGPGAGMESTSFLPRALNGVDEGNGPRTTNLFVGNASDNPAFGDLIYFAADGTEVLIVSFTLPGLGATVLDLDEQHHLPREGVWGVILQSDQPLVLGEVYYDDSARVSAGTYGSEAAETLTLPHIARTEDAHTVFSVQDTGWTETFISVSYLDVSGTPIYTQETTLPPGGWVRYDQSQMLQLGDHFEGSAVIEASAPVKALVDEYAPPSQHVLDVAIVGEGNVNIDPEQDDYAHGDVVTLTPSADPGWTFGGWSGPDADDLSYKMFGSWDLVMDSDKSVTATFTEDEYTLDVIIVGEGEVDINPEQDTYVYGDVVTLTATAHPGWSFAAWSGDVESTDNPLDFVVEGDAVITATFTEEYKRVYLPLVLANH